MGFWEIRIDNVLFTILMKEDSSLSFCEFLILTAHNFMLII